MEPLQNVQTAVLTEHIEALKNKKSLILSSSKTASEKALALAELRATSVHRLKMTAYDLKTLVEGLLFDLDAI